MRSLIFIGSLYFGCLLPILGYALLNEQGRVQTVPPQVDQLEPVLKTNVVVSAAPVPRKKKRCVPKGLALSFDDISWITKNVFFEARGEPEEGQIGVICVVFNRVMHASFPQTPKNVVTQGGERLFRCHFSWYCDGKSDRVQKKDREDFKRVRRLVLQVLRGEYIDVTRGALFYHAVRVMPKWAHPKHKTVRIGKHIFYARDVKKHELQIAEN